MRIQRLFLTLFGGLLVFLSSAQSDFTSWVGADASYNLNKDWKLGAEVQSRTNLRSGRFDALFLSPSVTWQPHKYLETGLSYRLTSVPYSSTTTNRVEKHRLTVDFTFRNIEKLLFKDKSRLGMSIRLRGTTEHQSEKRTENILRLKFKLEYNLPKTKLDLFASTEWFYMFQRDVIYTFSDVETVSGLDKYRVRLGVSYPIGDHHEIKFFGMNQWRFPDKPNEFVLALGYSYKIN